MSQDIIAVLEDFPFGLTVPALLDKCTGYSSRAELITDLSNRLAQGKVHRVGTVIALDPSKARDPVTAESLATTFMGNGHIRSLLTDGQNKEDDMRGGRAANPDQQRILDFFKQDPARIHSKRDIQGAFPSIKDFNLSYYLKNLCNDGSIKRHIRGAYSVNGPSLIPPPPQSTEPTPTQQTFRASSNPIRIPELGTSKSNEKALAAIKHLELLLEGHQATLDTIRGALVRLKRDIID